MTALKLPIPLNMEPMLSAPGDGIPKGDSWEYEPKWDGFRTLVFRDGDNIELVSRGARPMTRYFPELLPAFRKLRQDKVVLDGELIVVGAQAAQAPRNPPQGRQEADLSHPLYARPRDC